MTIDTNVTTHVNVTGAPLPSQLLIILKNQKNSMGRILRGGKKDVFYLTTLNLVRFLKETASQVEPPREGQTSNAQGCGSMETFRLFVSELCSEWFGGLFRVMQDHDCQRIMRVIGMQVQN
nr:hypothetical protein [Tanacetum cinerariifolium]